MNEQKALFASERQNGETIAAPLHRLVMPLRKYDVIYADPPWSYSYGSSVAGGRGQNTKYHCERCVDLFELPVADFAKDDATLFMWASYPMLPEALFCLRQWGFIYKTVAFVWVKKNTRAGTNFFGMGQWTRTNSEIVLLGVRGKPKRESKAVSQIIEAPIMEHSRKPNAVRLAIETLMGDVDRCELFSRGSFDGWDCYGNEA